MMRPQHTTHYDTLGIERDATAQEIRAAFHRLAMQHHPDRYQGDDRERAEQRFQAITEAFNVLNRPEARDKYDKEIASGGDSKTMDRTEIARRLANKGAQTLKEGRLPEAIEHLQMAIDHDDNSARAHYFMGMALSRVQGRERDAFRHVERAVVLEPDNATIKAEAASLALKVGLNSRAERFAQQALEIDPTQAKASEILAQLSDEPTPSGEGLFGRFRRKG